MSPLGILLRPRRSAPPETSPVLLRRLLLHSLSGPTFAVFGSNTGVGKTVVSAGLATSVLSTTSWSSFVYLKPLQTGFPSDSDSRFVFLKAASLSASPLLASNHSLFLSPAVGPAGGHSCEEALVGGGGAEATRRQRRLVCKTLYGWKAAVSPHLAVEREGMAVGDDEVRSAVERSLSQPLGGGGEEEGVWKVVETAGGVASPGPSGTLQCDLYRCVMMVVAAKIVFGLFALVAHLWIGRKSHNSAGNLQF